MIAELRQELGPHLSRLRVAVYGSGGAPSHHLALLALWGGNPEVIYADDIRDGNLSGYDAVIFPGGGLEAMAGQLAPLGAEGMTALRRWVEAGGTYLGSCAGSCHPLRMSAAYNEAYPDAEPFQVCDVTPLNAAAGAWGLDSPGTGRLRVAPGPGPLFEGLTESFEIVHYNGPLFPNKEGSAGRVLGSTAHFTSFEVSQGAASGETVLECAFVQGAFVAYQQRVGDGQVIVFGSHPEFGSSPLQLGWLPAAKLLGNALRLVPFAKESAPPAIFSLLSEGSLSAMSRTVAALESAFDRAAPLKNRLPATTPAFLGMSGEILWDAVLKEGAQLTGALGCWLDVCPAQEKARGLHLLDCAPKAGQDVGFMGARQLLGQALELAQRAIAPDAKWQEFAGAYDQLGSHPFHLLVGSYLSACGLVAAAALQVTAFTTLNSLALPYPVPIS